MPYDRNGNFINYGYSQPLQQQYFDPNQNDPNLSRSLTNHFYKLSTQTNMLILGYILLMGVNHMILGDIIYNPNNTFDEKKKNWFFSTVFFCTVINCFILLWLKEKKLSSIAQHFIEYLQKEKDNINKISFTIPKF